MRSRKRLVKVACGVITFGSLFVVLVEYFRVVQLMALKFPPGFEIDITSKREVLPKDTVDEKRLQRELRRKERRSELARKEKAYFEEMEQKFPGHHNLAFDVDVVSKSSSGILNPLEQSSSYNWLYSALGRNDTQEFLRTSHLPLSITSERQRLRPKSSVTSEDDPRTTEKVYRQMVLFTEEAKEAKDKGTYKKIGLIGGRFAWQLDQVEFKNCPVSSCQLLPRALDLKHLQSADAILFKGEHVVLPKYLDDDEDGESESAGKDDIAAGTSPQAVRDWRRRKPDQIWIYYSQESVAALRKLRSASWPAEVFNWTATYRLDSDIPTTYGLYYSFPESTWGSKSRSVNDSNEDYGVLKNSAKGKTRLAAAFISNCDDVQRLAYIEALQNHTPVDVYGACGNLTCPKTDPSCLDLLTTDYKFYLAFENRRCRDYITEKFFVNALNRSVVPVVMGGKSVDDYLKVAPPDSFIHVDDFQGPAELAKYLLKLDKNDILYNRYFQWKRRGFISNDRFLCRLCAMLHNTGGQEGMKRNRIGNIYEWNKEDECDLASKIP